MDDGKDTYNGNIRKIEKDIVEYLISSPIYSTRNEITSRILIYIILRKEISQNLLKKLTGYSSGKISQELNNLVDSGMIIRKKIPGIRKKLYTFESVEKISAARIKNIVAAMTKWEVELAKMKNEMITKRSKLGNMNGYDNVMKVIDFYLPAMKLYEKFAESLEIE
jgi:DNA-binding transcriptional regulator GbsR (MarR family)